MKITKAELREIILEEYKKLKEEIKKVPITENKDILSDFFKGDITKEELIEKSKKAGKNIATKQELEQFLKNKFMQDVMADTYNIPAKQLVKKVKELITII